MEILKKIFDFIQKEDTILRKSHKLYLFSAIGILFLTFCSYFWNILSYISFPKICVINCVFFHNIIPFIICIINLCLEGFNYGCFIKNDTSKNITNIKLKRFFNIKILCNMLFSIYYSLYTIYWFLLFIISKQEDSNFYKLEMNCLSVYTSCIHD